MKFGTYIVPVNRKTWGQVPFLISSLHGPAAPILKTFSTSICPSARIKEFRKRYGDFMQIWESSWTLSTLSQLLLTPDKKGRLCMNTRAQLMRAFRGEVTKYLLERGKFGTEVLRRKETKRNACNWTKGRRCNTLVDAVRGFLEFRG